MTDKIKEAELIPEPTKASKWKVKHDGKEESDKSLYPVIELGKNKGPHLIVFKIKDGPGITFSSDPIWVQAGTTPPSHHSESDQIPTWQVRDAGKKLVVFDWNDQPGDLAYRLNFNGYDPLDPIIRNGGGTGEPPPPGDAVVPGTAVAPVPEATPGYLPPYSGAEITVAGLALLVAFIVGFLVRHFR